MKPILNSFVILSIVFLSSPVPAASSDMTTEINHLLSFVENTGCQYERNGKLYTGEEALGHIKRKYDYFKDKIQTAEDFIELSATKSTMSGKFYLIHCKNRPAIKSKTWLLRELKSYRSAYNGKLAN